MLSRGFVRVISRALLLVAIVGVASVLDAYLYEPTHPKVYFQRIDTPAIPRDLAELRIVQLSDLHIVKPGIRERRMVRMVNRLKPDLVLLTGDYVNDDGITPGNQEWHECAKNAISVMRKLKPRRGIFAVLGNWDAPAMADMIREAGIVVLQDDYRLVKVGNSLLVIAGIDRSQGGLGCFGGRAPKGDFTILLSHLPEAAEEVGKMTQPFDLVLAGHYHGGQARIPFLRQAMGHDIKYISGLYRVGNTTLYVNRGIGMHTEAVRYRCRPEITLFKLSRSGR